MAKGDTYELEVCIDCAMILVNDDPNPEWSQSEEIVHRDQMRRNLSDLIVFPASDDEEIQFSKAPCDACHGKLAGTRIKFTAEEIK